MIKSKAGQIKDQQIRQSQLFCLKLHIRSTNSFSALMCSVCSSESQHKLLLAFTISLQKVYATFYDSIVVSSGGSKILEALGQEFMRGSLNVKVFGEDFF